MPAMSPKTAAERIPGADAAVSLLDTLIRAAEETRAERVLATRAAVGHYTANREGFGYTMLCQCQAAQARTEADLRVLRKQRALAVGRYNRILKACNTE